MIQIILTPLLIAHSQRRCTRKFIVVQARSYVRNSPASEAIYIVAGIPTPTADCSRSLALSFDGLHFQFVSDSQDRTGILIFVDQFSKMTRLVPIHATITAVETAAHSVDAVFCHHGLSKLLSRNVIFDSHAHFGRHCSRFFARSCKCRQRLIRKWMGKPSVSNGTSKIFFNAMLLHLRIEVHYYHLLSSYLTILCTRQQS